MAGVTLEQVLEDVKALSREEQARVREALEQMLAHPRPPMTEDEFEAEMVRKGILGPPPPKNPPPPPFPDFEPVKVEGKPISETVIEERR